MKNKTVFQKINNESIESFVNIINQQKNDKAFSNTAALLLFMFDERKKIIEHHNPKRDKKAINSSVYFIFQACIAFKRAFPKYNNENICRFVYSGMVLTGLNSCPDVWFPQSIKLLNDIDKQHTQ